MYRVLVVCMGNICRSPMAEAASRAQIERAGMAAFVEIDSAGTNGYHAGERPDERARQVAGKRGYDLSKLRARKIAEEDFEVFDLILAMDKDNLKNLLKRCPEHLQSKIGLFLREGGEVPDPYYGNLEGFERVLDLCEVGAKDLILRLQDQWVSRGG